MKILAIETSCDETAIAVTDASGDENNAAFRVLGNALLSQIDIHKGYGGVFPALAKREHAKNLVPLLEAVLEEAEMLHEDTQALPNETRDKIAAILSREGELAEAFFAFIGEYEPPAVDAIAVTSGPGLEPALWVGVNFAKALALAWGKPVVAVNHMEGHVIAALASGNHAGPRQGATGAETALKLKIQNVELPLLALLISGGHTELVLMKEWLAYELIGQTRDDAVGEAFDKVARMLSLPYPGGPEISRLAEQARRQDIVSPSSDDGLTMSIILPRPMIHDASCDFSFAGLKTAVLYLLKERGGLSDKEKQQLAREFEDAVADVLWHKTARALRESGATTLVIGGGVSANTHIRRTFQKKMGSEFPETSLKIPAASLTTDNALMIAMAGYYRAFRKDFADLDTLRADGNARLATIPM